MSPELTATEAAVIKTLPWRSARFSLRRIVTADAPLMNSLTSDRRVWRYLGGVITRPVEETRDAIEAGKGLTQTLLVIERDGCDRPIGLAAIYENEQVGEAEGDFLLALLPEHQGQGFGGELLALLMERWRAALDRSYCTATVNPENAPSISILRQAGFRKVREYASPKSGNRDIYRFDR